MLGITTKLAVNAVSSFRVVVTLERIVTLGRPNYNWDLHQKVQKQEKIYLFLLFSTTVTV